MGNPRGDPGRKLLWTGDPITILSSQDRSSQPELEFNYSELGSGMFSRPVSWD